MPPTTTPTPVRGKPFALAAVFLLGLVPGAARGQTPEPFPGKKSQWEGFDRYEFQRDDKKLIITAPRQPLPGRLWVWKGIFHDALPGPEKAMLEAGLYTVYAETSYTLGSPRSVKDWNDCYQELTEKQGLAKKPALIGLSRGGLYVYNWAAANPNQVACIYADNAVCDFKSWPGGKGKGKGSPGDWKHVLAVYGFKDEAAALAYDKNPVDNLKPLAAAKVPLLHVYGELDDVVPWQENTGLIAERYRKLGGDITLIAKPRMGHHPHGLEKPQPIVDFLVKHLQRANADPEALEQKKARRRWFEEARFGMFIHWGLYSSFAGEWQGERGHGEWIYLMANIPPDAYRARAREFNPTKFDARRWVQVARDAGMKYIVVTAKHHDGFGMFDSKLTDFTITKATPFQRDPLAELAAECRKQGLVFCVYYSVIDWSHPDFPAVLNPVSPKTKKHFHAIPDNPGNIDRYVDFMKGQLTELLTNYGPVGVVWFDGGPGEKAKAAEVLAHIRKISPQTIVNDRLAIPADYVTTEQWVPRAGQVKETFEACMTMNNHWSYCKSDTDSWKSAGVLVRNLVRAASLGGNYLLNVGPDSAGVIPEASVERLTELGAWMKANGESLHGTQAGPLKEFIHGLATVKPGKLYLHIFEWPAGGKLLVPGLRNTVKSAYLLRDRRALNAQPSADGLLLDVPGKVPDPLDTVIVLEFPGEPKVDAILEFPNLAIGGRATASSEHDAEHAAGKVLIANPQAHWKAARKGPGEWIEVDLGRKMVFDEVHLVADGGGLRIRGFKVQCWDNGTWRELYTGKEVTENVSFGLPRHRIRCAPVASDKVRVVVTDALEPPIISKIEVYHTRSGLARPETDEKGQPRVYDPPPAPRKNLARGATATASSQLSPMHGPGNVCDGDPRSHWKPQARPGEWLEIDFGTELRFDHIVLAALDGGPSSIRKFYIQCLENGVWRDVYSGTTLTENIQSLPRRHRIQLRPLATNKIRLVITEIANAPPLINELEVYHSASAAK